MMSAWLVARQTWRNKILRYEHEHVLPHGDDPALPQSDEGLVIQFLADWMQHPTLASDQLRCAAALEHLAPALLLLCARARKERI